jgi:signal transduction histidine kinase
MTGRRIALIAWSFALALLVAALFLSILNGTFSRDPLEAVSLLVMAAYTTVGAILVSRLPRNPVSWLFLAVGASILLGGLGTEYATYALQTSPGSLPFGVTAAWIESWAFLGILAIPLLLLLFPTGRVPTDRWRWVPAAMLVSAGALAVATMFRPGPIDVTTETQPQNPLGIEALAGALKAIVWISGLGFAALSVACVVALVLRFRRSRGDERQQLRWLAAIGALAALFLVAALATGIGIGPNETRLANDIAFLLFYLGFGLGIPLAALLALLKYRLYDLDLVVRKTVVFTIVAVALTILYLAALALATVSGLGPLAGAVVFVLTFNPVRRRAHQLADRLVYGKRATPFEVLSEFSERVGDTYSIDDVLPRMTQLVAGGTGATEVRVWLRREREMTVVATWPEDAPPAAELPVEAEDLPDFGADVAPFPVAHHGELLGAITLRSPANDPMDASKERLVAGLASQAGLALRNVGLVQDLRESRRRIVAAQDERAKRIERNIHDGAQQQLVALAVQLRLLEQTIDRDPETAKRQARLLQTAANETLEDLRDLARGIYPPLLADRGLSAALEAQVRRAALPVQLEAQEMERLRPDAEAAVYFCVLEALNNVAKYASAGGAAVRLSRENGAVLFRVEDDGIGFDPEATSYGTGLRGMADRLEAIGGSLSVTSAPGTGTVVAGRVPVSEA